MCTSLASSIAGAIPSRRSQRRITAALVLFLPVVLIALLFSTRGAGALRNSPQPVSTTTLVRGAGLAPARREQLRTPAGPARVGSEARDLEEAGRAARPRAASRWGEREHYEHFLALPASELAKAAGPLLRGDGPDCAKVALLRALDDRDREAAMPWLAWVLRELPDQSKAASVSVPAFVVRFLSEAAPHDRSARDVLWDATWGAQRMAPSLRGRAASAFASSASEEELALLQVELSTESDPLVRAGVLQALQSNPDPAAVRRWFPRFQARSDATSSPSSNS